MVANLTVLNNKPDAHGGRSFSPSGCDPNARCGNGLEKIYPTCAVRYGYMGYVGEFKYAPGMLFGCGAKVVIQSNRGIELGEQVSLTCSGCNKSVKRDTMLQYVKNSGPDFYQLKRGRILREATPQDLLEDRHITQGAEEKLASARDVAATYNLPMKFVACEHLFGGERIIFHFMAETRLDFRDFVRDMAHQYHTRIEMHQVGARDEARLVADYEICGRECCCKNFLKTLRPISMRMAKLQKATLDPSKVSGRCGRLRCCLRYEHDGYEDLNKKLPRVGQRVRTDRGPATITDRQILTQLLTVQYDVGGEVETVGIEDVLERDLPPMAPREEAPGPAGGGPARGWVAGDRGRSQPDLRRRADDRPVDGNASAQADPIDGREQHGAGRPERSGDDSPGSRGRRRRRRRGRPGPQAGGPGPGPVDSGGPSGAPPAG